MRPLLIALLLLATTPAYGARWRLRSRPSAPRVASSEMAGRICSSASCGMCARLHAAYETRNAPEWLPDPVPAPDELPYVPTPRHVVDAMLAAVRPTTRDVLYDLGCGDGRILIAAVADYGCRAVGIEVNAETADLARRNVKAAGLEGKIRIRTGDALKFDLDGATVVTMYLYVDTMVQLTPYITKATRIVSYSHPIPGRVNTRFTVGEEPVYVWRAK